MSSFGSSEDSLEVRVSYFLPYVDQMPLISGQRICGEGGAGEFGLSTLQQRLPIQLVEQNLKLSFWRITRIRLHLNLSIFGNIATQSCQTASRPTSHAGLRVSRSQAVYAAAGSRLEVAVI